MNTALSPLTLTEKSRERLSYFLEIEELHLALLLVLSLQSSADVLIDVGANMGFYSLVIGHYKPEIRGWAYEASPESFKELTANLEALGCADLKPRPIALSNRTGQALFHDYGGCSGRNGLASTSFYPPGLERQELEVATTTLDRELADLQGQHLVLKIDTEGHELEVIQGATNLLRDNKAVVQIETGHGLRGMFAQQLLQQLGYRECFRLGPDQFFSNHADHEDPAVLKRILQSAMDFIVRLRWNAKSRPVLR